MTLTKVNSTSSTTVAINYVNLCCPDPNVPSIGYVITTLWGYIGKEPLIQCLLHAIFFVGIFSLIIWLFWLFGFSIIEYEDQTFCYHSKFLHDTCRDFFFVCILSIYLFLTNAVSAISHANFFLRLISRMRKTF